MENNCNIILRRRATINTFSETVDYNSLMVRQTTKEEKVTHNMT